ncbi:MAG: hypothetical protein KDK30_04125 [Leptospiraceae bacterium]|nr:hypothetical protein [Leptospiraceae bacterium]MCB1316940.1 hypothetical protein [Leptospiraceae bacterium]MCB1322256.1 hypothetical protein [Leptospiraceae bacterium]
MKRYGNIVTAFLLLGIIAVMYIISDNLEGAALLILALSGIKFMLVGLQFMEVRTAHPAYGLWLGLLFLSFAVGVFWLV